MAKSLGNFTTLKDALDAHGPRAMRMAVLQTHYRSPVEIGDRELDDAGEAVARLDALARRARGRRDPCRSAAGGGRNGRVQGGDGRRLRHAGGDGGGVPPRP